MPVQKTTDEGELRKELSTRLSALQGEQQERIAKRRADTLGAPYVSLVTFPIDPDVLERVPKALAQEAKAVLFYKEGKDMRVGAINPKLPGVEKLLAALEKDIGVKPQVYVISDRSFDSALSRYRRDKVEEEIPQEEMRVDASQASKFEEALEDLQELGKRITSLPPTEVLEAIVLGSVKMGASDIHIEPREKDARLRYRIDGVLQDITSFARDGWSLVLSRVKVLSGLKLNIHEVPQDGSFVLKVGEDTFDMRVSILPGGYGENIVIRLLDRKSEALELTDLGMKQRDFDLVQESLKLPNGMILVTGPTGSGKTTTLASFLQSVNRKEIKVITLEDPIEYRIPGVEQTEVHEDEGYTFAKGLRSILRQDPDVVLVGEMRDAETAETATHAALTGHLVFSTLHTNNAPGAVPRLLAMGVRPFILAPALNMIIAQRLVRVLCKECASEYTPDAKMKEVIKDAMEGVRPDVFDPAILNDKSLKFRKAEGCPACGETGYKGRVGVFEIFSVEGAMEALVLKGADSGQILEEALKQGMTTIAQDAYLKVIEGVTTIEEVKRISEE